MNRHVQKGKTGSGKREAENVWAIAFRTCVVAINPQNSPDVESLEMGPAGDVCVRNGWLRVAQFYAL
jgi:hypothetical protein